MTPRIKPEIVIVTGALLGLTSVMAGAAIDHLTSGLTCRADIALHYHQLYAAVITGIGLLLALPHWLPRQRTGLTYAALLFTIGLLLFSGGLYLADLTALHGLVYLVPFGGGAFMLGWACIAIAFISRKEKPL